MALSSVDGTFSQSLLFGGVDLGPRVQLNFRVEEGGKLTGTFDVKVHLNVEDARRLAVTLQEAVARVEEPY